MRDHSSEKDFQACFFLKCAICKIKCAFFSRQNIQSKLNVNPYDTRGEEILTRYEDDYKFHRYTNRYGNAFGSEFYAISITCRTILTDPEIYSKLHDTHYSNYNRYYGYWYGLDLNGYDPSSEARYVFT